MPATITDVAAASPPLSDGKKRAVCAEGAPTRVAQISGGAARILMHGYRTRIIAYA
jgi:hypothetical protein